MKTFIARTLCMVMLLAGLITSLSSYATCRPDAAYVAPVTLQGVAVQLGNKQSGTYVVQNLNNAMSVSKVPGSNTTMVSFPLGAHIVKTDIPVRASSVSTSPTYTINYQ